MPIHVLGIGADGVAGLNPRLRMILAEAQFVAGGRRHLAMLEPSGIETFAIADNLAALADRLERRGEAERCVVLASGDPFFYGIGAFLRTHFAHEDLIVEPSASSAQLAFARAGIAWNEAAIASIHGRPPAETLRPLLGRPLIGLFTRDGESPAQVAEFFLSHDLADYEAIVGEDLGGPSERVTKWGLSDLVGRSFRPLNFLILARQGGAGRTYEAVARDRDFSRPESGAVLLTHEDIRAVVMNRFRDLPEGPIWDVGAGLGGVSIDLARRFPAREVVAIERSLEQLRHLRENRGRFAAYNLRIVEGEAPEALESLASPAGVFLGGSGSRLDAILDRVMARCKPKGVLVANFVGLENVSRCLERLRAADWPVRIDQVQVSQGRGLAGLTTFVPLRPVWIVGCVKCGEFPIDGI